MKAAAHFEAGHNNSEPTSAVTHVTFISHEPSKSIECTALDTAYSRANPGWRVHPVRLLKDWGQHEKNIGANVSSQVCMLCALPPTQDFTPLYTTCTLTIEYCSPSPLCAQEHFFTVLVAVAVFQVNNHVVETEDVAQVARKFCVQPIGR
jgi:hypothetical protein